MNKFKTETFTEFLEIVDSTPEVELKESLFKDKEYIDTPGDWSNFKTCIGVEKLYPNGVMSYYQENVSERDIKGLKKIWGEQR